MGEFALFLLLIVFSGVGFLLGAKAVIVNLPSEKDKTVIQLLKECEKNIPRNQICVLYAKPKETP